MNILVYRIDYTFSTKSLEYSAKTCKNKYLKAFLTLFAGNSKILNIAKAHALETLI